jgi:glycine/D-amino acid oxidase-like deaminating enzyme
MRILDDSDVCIIGGGLVGSNIACRLSKEKKKVILLEKKSLTAGASEAACRKASLFWMIKSGPLRLVDSSGPHRSSGWSILND